MAVVASQVELFEKQPLRWHGSVEGVVEQCSQVETLRVAAVEDFAGVVDFFKQRP